VTVFPDDSDAAARALARVLDDDVFPAESMPDYPADFEMARAARDVALLQRALAVIRDEAAFPASALPATARPSTAGPSTARPELVGVGGPGRRTRMLRRGAIGLAAASTAAAAIAWFAVPSFDGGDTPSSQRPASRAGTSITREAAIACDRIIAEGTVVDVSDGSQPGRARLALDVRTWLKPTSGPKRLTLDVPDPAAEGASARWLPGEVLLVMVPSDPDQLIDSYGGSEIKDARAWVDDAIARAPGVECPRSGKGTG
jgi:hypothetical protein